MTNELLGYVSAFIQAVLVCLVLFGVPLSSDQIAGILAVVAAGGALAFAINTRKGKPAEIRDAARKQGVNV